MTCGIYGYWDNKKDVLAYIGKSINNKRKILTASTIPKLKNKVLNNNLEWRVIK